MDGEDAPDDRRGSAAYEIVERVAAIEGRPGPDLPPLYDVVDPEALEAIAETGAVRITFTYCSHEIVVHDGEIRVDP